jgi:cbb3-type cytochrome oxidase maturation protein
MNIVLILAPLSLLLAGFFVFVFFRAADGGQFLDLETPAHRMLTDSVTSDEEKGKIQ